jgi:hypothetical protein
MLVTPIATGSVTLQSLINVLGSFSSLGYTVFGYNDGAGMPDATTQADIDALIALGIPEARIAWVDLGTLNAFTIAGASSASSIDNLVLALAGGVFAIGAASSASAIENIIITSEGLSAFTIQDAGSLSNIDDVVITSIGQFIVAAIASASAIENVAMVQHGGTFAVATVASASAIENVEISEQVAAGGSNDFEAGSLGGWTTIYPAGTMAISTDGAIAGTKSVRFEGTSGLNIVDTYAQDPYTVRLVKTIALSTGTMSFKFKLPGGYRAELWIDLTILATLDTNNDVQTLSYNNTTYTGSQNVSVVVVQYAQGAFGEDQEDPLGYEMVKTAWIDDIIMP